MKFPFSKESEDFIREGQFDYLYNLIVILILLDKYQVIPQVNH